MKDILEAIGGIAFIRQNQGGVNRNCKANYMDQICKTSNFLESVSI